jgi:membrane-associated protease RseP (regulator of RpoE activity)
VSPFLIFLILLNAYVLLLFILVRTGWMQKLGMSLFGPALMIKTQRGRFLLDWFAKARGFFIGGATLGTWITAVIMVLMSLVLVLQVFFIFQIPPEAAPSPRLIIGLPGINPIIPVGFGVIALIFAVVVHEFSHGILARAYDLKVKTMGLLFFIVPVGAFVEPDEDELKRAPRKARIHVFAAGVISNLFFAVLFGIVFSSVLMSQAEPIEGAPIQTVRADTPAYTAGLLPGMIINGINGQVVRTQDDFSKEVGKAEPGDTVIITTMKESQSFAVQTKRCAELYTEEDCRRATADDPMNRTVIGLSIYNTQAVHRTLTRPFHHWTATLVYLSLPFEAIRGAFPLTGVYQHFYTVPFDPGVFWFLTNLLFWLFWIDLMLGLTNALPMVPLDGGHIFKDFLGHFVDKWAPGRSAEARDGLVRRTATIVAFTLLGLVLLQFVGPYIASVF